MILDLRLKFLQDDRRRAAGHTFIEFSLNRESVTENLCKDRDTDDQRLDSQEPVGVFTSLSLERHDLLDVLGESLFEDGVGGSGERHADNNESRGESRWRSGERKRYGRRN